MHIAPQQLCDRAAGGTILELFCYGFRDGGLAKHDTGAWANNKRLGVFVQ
jgi:hypothetical protein